MQVLSESTKAVSSDSCAIDLLAAIPNVMWFIRCNMRKRRAKGLSVPQFRMLATLKRYPNSSLSVIAEKVGSSLPTASRSVAGLVTRGYIARTESSDDRRQIVLQLTPRGEEVYDIAYKGTQAALSAKLAGLTPDQCASLTTAMDVVKQVFSRPNQAVAAAENGSLQQA